MCGNVVCLAVMLLGIDARWPPLPDGGVQFVVQIEPHLLDRLTVGTLEPILSYVPTYVTDVRVFQITAGTQRLAKDAPAANLQSPILTGVDVQWNPLADGGAECHVSVGAEALEQLKRPGAGIYGEVPAHVAPIRVFKITAGTAWPPPTTEVTDNAAPSAERPPASPPFSGSPAMPATFHPEVDSKPIPAQAASHTDTSVVAAKTASQSPSDAKAAAGDAAAGEEPGKLGLPFVLVLIGLFVSLGGNVFLLWIARDFRGRYCELLGQSEQSSPDV